uniref:Uncharacterized protein n=1 Tax=Arundo donax TaxID=35708 RepID=A0A0A8ZQ92_ARUDO
MMINTESSHAPQWRSKKRPLLIILTSN